MTAGWRAPVRSQPSGVTALRVPLIASLAVGLSIVGGCEQKTSSPTGSTPAAAQFPEPDQVYTGIMGTVAQLPNPSRPLDEFQLWHEPIPNFVGRDGTIPTNADGSTGMKSMTMSFTPGPGVSLEGLEPGDRVRFDFAVNWNHTPRHWLTSITPVEDAKGDGAEQPPMTDEPQGDHDMGGHDHDGG